MLERERGNAASHSLENSLWICLWACCKTDYEVMMMMMMMIMKSENMWPTVIKFD